MKAILRACRDVFLLRRGPQVFPRSWPLFAIVASAYFVTDALLFLFQGVTVYGILLQTVFDMALQAGFFALVMGAKFVMSRWNQALLAWFGAGIFLNVLYAPVALAYRYAPSPWAGTWLLIPLALVVAWSMLVMGHILRHALDLHFRVLGLDLGFALAFIIAAVYTFVSVAVFSALFPT